MIVTDKHHHLLQSLLREKLEWVKGQVLSKDPLDPKGQGDLLRLQGQYRLLEQLLSDETMEKIFG